MAVMDTESAMMALSRPQVGIDRLQVRKAAGEQKEAMNCKSCRKRKIKCNRLKPSCEACQVFNCACVYDAIPKKRGPKTDVLEALLKRVNGLEKRLKDENKSTSPEGGESSSSPQEPAKENHRGDASDKAPFQRSPPRPEAELPELQNAVRCDPIPIDRAMTAQHEALAFTDALLDTFFARVHNKPYYILDETATRQRLRDGRLPRFLVNAIHAVSIRYVPQLSGGHHGAIRSSQDYAVRSRAEIDVDEPSIDNLQALLLLAMANFQNGKGKRCYMVLTHAVSMSFALDLHRELAPEFRISASEREGRRKLFWTCYLMDRFTVSGSKRPSLISDESVHLRLPGWQPPGSQVWVDGGYFPNGSSQPYASGAANAGQGSNSMLVEIVRILGITNRYLGAGGVKGDSHFPWHAQSTLSRIRSDLDYWAAATQDVFTSIDTLFGSHDSSTLVLSKLIYHLIHCLIYRPFLPVDLAELSGTGQNQSWQIEATNLCFLHANAIAELIEIGKNTALLDWPSFVGYCICTAGTIHVHGAHYMSYRDGDAFCHSAEFLSREMAQLFELRSIWTGVQHQRDTLQTVYASHGQLVKSLASNPMRFSPVFQMEDFFDRYPGSYIDGAHVTFADVVMDASFDTGSQFDGFSHQADVWPAQFLPDVYQPPTTTIPSQPSHFPGAVRKTKKRRSTASSSLPYPTPKADPSLIYHAVEEENEEEHESIPPSAAPVGGGNHNHHHHQIPEQSIEQEQEQPQHDDSNPMLFQGTFTPNFAFSPIQSALTLKSLETNHAHDPYGNLHNHDQSFDQSTTPSGVTSHSTDVGHHVEVENDPFLSLLEQLAENDTSSVLAGHENLDFFLGGGGGGQD